MAGTATKLSVVNGAKGVKGVNGWVRAGRAGLVVCAAALATAAAAPADAEPEPGRPPSVRAVESGPGDSGPSVVIDDGHHRQVRVSGTGDRTSVVVRGRPGCVTVVSRGDLGSAVLGPRCPVPP
ncbi:hypothetical protein, partial [Streptomyces sp. UNOC14_S4]|uniref:hypothetical protein n=1 Tax=Streptomyces sp. UNOC14_S4 TaxID=2872340 RepID=UPI001E60F941